MLQQFRHAFMIVTAMTILTGLLYPLGMISIAQLLFPYQANGSLIEKDGQVIGSKLVGQVFTSDTYFHGRPSAATPLAPVIDVVVPTAELTQTTRIAAVPIAFTTEILTASTSFNYDSTASGGSNLGPTNASLIARVTADVERLRDGELLLLVPIDLITSSGSGLDPDITPAAAEFQIQRVAQARNLPQWQVRRLVTEMTEGRIGGVLGEVRVNVLELNLRLDEMTERAKLLL